VFETKDKRPENTVLKEITNYCNDVKGGKESHGERGIMRVWGLRPQRGLKAELSPWLGDWGGGSPLKLKAFWQS